MTDNTKTAGIEDGSNGENDLDFQQIKLMLSHAPAELDGAQLFALLAMILDCYEVSPEVRKMICLALLEGSPGIRVVEAEAVSPDLLRSILREAFGDYSDSRKGGPN